MYRGELKLIGGDEGHFEYEGLIKRDLHFIVYGESDEQIYEKLRQVLPNVKAVAPADKCSEAYCRDFAALPMQACEKLVKRRFAFFLNYDNYDDNIGGANFHVTHNFDAMVIVLQ